MRGLSPVAASRGHSSSRCAGLSLSRPLPLRSTGSRRAGSVVVAHGLSCSVACGILPDQGSNPCPLHWQADSFFFFRILYFIFTRDKWTDAKHCKWMTTTKATMIAITKLAGGFLTTAPPGKPNFGCFDFSLYKQR